MRSPIDSALFSLTGKSGHEQLKLPGMLPDPALREKVLRSARDFLLLQFLTSSITLIFDNSRFERPLCCPSESLLQNGCCGDPIKLLTELLYSLDAVMSF